MLNPKNIFLESCSELGLSLAKDLTLKMVNDSYNKLLDQHFQAIQKGEAPAFELDKKKKAKAYLLDRL